MTTNPFANAVAPAAAAPVQEAPAQPVYQQAPPQQYAPAAPQYAPTPAQQPTAQPQYQGNGYGAAAPFSDAPSTNPAPAAPVGDPFSDPSPSTKIKFATFRDRLVICKPLEIIPSMNTENGEATDVVRCNIAVLDGPQPGQIAHNVLVFQTDPKRDLGDIFRDPAKSLLIGRVHQVSKEVHKNEPYKFLKATDQDKALGIQFLQSPLAASF